MSAPLLLDADAVRAACGPAAAVEAITTALNAGVDPAADLPRQAVPLRSGQLLLMPSEGARGGAHVGIKVATVAPGNPVRGLPRIQGCYLLFDAASLSLVAMLDGTALTTLRTPAVSVAAVAPRLRAGSGPVAGAEVVPLGGRRARDVLRAADVVVCATAARSPLFDADLIADSAVVIAVGSHHPDARELPGALCARATVVVEDVATALREAGDVCLALDEGALQVAEMVPMRDVVTGSVLPDPARPLVFKSVGMSWQDLVVAEAVLGGRWAAAAG